MGQVFTGTATDSVTGKQGGLAVALPPVGVPSLVGATTTDTDYSTTQTWLQAGQTFNTLVGYPMATAHQKWYQQLGVYSATVPARISQLAAVGCEFMLSLKPSLTQSVTEQQNLANLIAMFQQGGVSFDACLWQEVNDPGSGVATAAAYAAYVAFYAPVICNPAQYWTIGGTPPVPVNLIYDPGASDMPTAVSFWPGNGAGYSFYAIGCDFYSTVYVNQSSGKLLGATDYLAPLEQIADGNGLPFGLCEWGNSAGAMTASNPYFNSVYAPYVAGKFGGRISAGKKNYVMDYFNSTNANGQNFNTVLQPAGSPPVSDPKIPGIQQVYMACSSTQF